MAFYKLYAGLGGSFESVDYCGTYEYDSEEDAVQDAYELAVEIYESTEGYHGIASYSEIYEEYYYGYLENHGIEDDSLLTDADLREIESDAMEEYEQQREDFLEYYVELDPDATEEIVV